MRKSCRHQKSGKTTSNLKENILWILWMDELKLESFDEVTVLLPRLLSILPPMGGIYLGRNHGCENKARSSSPSARGPGDFPTTRRLIAWFCRMKNAQSCPFIWLRSSFGWNLAGNVVKSQNIRSLIKPYYRLPNSASHHLFSGVEI